jgi:hypothetical protein
VPTLLGILGTALIGGAFIAYPWGSPSTARTVLASALWAGGFLLWLAAVLAERRHTADSEPAAESPERSSDLFIAARKMNIGEGAGIITPDSGNTTLISDDLQNQGYIGPQMQPQTSKLEAFADRINAVYRRGQEICWVPNNLGFKEQADEWSRDTFRLLNEALGPAEASVFATYAYEQDPFAPPGAGRNHAHALQLESLKGVITSLNHVTIKDTWQP